MTSNVFNRFLIQWMQLPLLKSSSHLIIRLSTVTTAFSVSLPFLSIKLEDIALIRERLYNGAITICVSLSFSTLFQKRVLPSAVGAELPRPARPASVADDANDDDADVDGNNLPGFKLTWLVLSSDEINDRK